MEKINRGHMCNMDIIKLIKSDGFNILIDDFQKNTFKFIKKEKTIVINQKLLLTHNYSDLFILYNIYKTSKKNINYRTRVYTNLRNLIGQSIRKRGFTKKSKTQEILGCSFEDFKSYIESKFEPWMNWNNRGKYNGELNYGWDIDHIIPLSSAKTEEEIIKLNHYTNLQPLCSYFNRVIKRNKILKSKKNEF